MCRWFIIEQAETCGEKGVRSVVGVGGFALWGASVSTLCVKCQEQVLATTSVSKHQTIFPKEDHIDRLHISVYI